MKAIVLTYAPITDEDAQLLRDTNIYKIACNYYRSELNPDVRLTADDIVDKCLQADNCPVVSLNYDLNKERVINGCFLPDRHTTLVSCCDYLVYNGYTQILLVATNTITNNAPISQVFQKINRTGINSLKGCANIYKYTPDGVLDVPFMSIKEFIRMENLEDLILGNDPEKAPERLLKTLAFSEDFKYKVETIGKDNASFENGILIDNILPAEQKEEILNGVEIIEYNGMRITRITGIKPADNSVMTYQEMKDFVKENNIEVSSMKKNVLEQAIKEFKGE